MGSGGGSSGGGQPQQTSTVTTQQLSPEQRKLLKPVIPVAQDFVNNPPTLFPGSTIAPRDPLQDAAQQSALTQLGVIEPVAQGGLAAQQSLQLGGTGVGLQGIGDLVAGLGQANPALDFILSGDVLTPDANPALQRTIDAAIQPLIQQFNTGVLPNIRGGAVQAGQLGGSRQGIAEGLAAQGLQRSVGDVSANIATQSYLQGLSTLDSTLGNVLNAGQGAAQSGLQTGLGGLLALPQTLQAGLFPSSIQEIIGGQRRGEEQAVLSEQAQRFFAEQILPFAAAQDVAQLAFGFPGGQVQTLSQGAQAPGVGGNPFITGLGGAAAGASLGSAFSPGVGTGIGALLGAALGAFS